MKFNFFFAAIITLVIIGTPIIFAIHFPSIDNDMEFITVEITDIQILSMDDTPGYYLDNADLVKITINITNDNLDYFLLSDKMIKLWVMEPDYRKSTLDKEVLDLVDNYSTIYDDELEVIYDNLQSRELFEECDWIIERIRIEQSKEITVCYNILRIWNNEVVNIDGEKQYYLVMMNNNQATSCPNCKKIPLSSFKENFGIQTPTWVQNLFIWYNQGMITEQDFQNSIEYLIESGIMAKTTNHEVEPDSLENKIHELKEHQARLILAQQTNLHVSMMNFFESDYDENFSGVVCKRQNNIVTLSGDYSNEDQYYNTIFFKLLVFDELGNVVTTGISKMVDVTAKEFRGFSVSTPFEGKMNSCFVMVDSRFSQGVD